jgi:hypothetical protein
MDIPDKYETLRYNCFLLHRLKYLLNQSDIFSHFGLGGKKKDFKDSSSPRQSEVPESSDNSKSKHRRSATTTKKSGDFDEMDEDEQAIFQEENDENETGARSDDKPHNTILLKQPSLITGGAMRYFILII